MYLFANLLNMALKVNHRRRTYKNMKMKTKRIISIFVVMICMVIFTVPTMAMQIFVKNFDRQTYYIGGRTNGQN